MRHFIFLLYATTSSLALLLPSLAHAVQVSVESPDKAQTFVYGSIKNRRLGWDAAKKLFYAEVSFTNERYAGFGEKVENETFRFNFPGVNFDEKTQTFFVLTTSGRTIPVARVEKQFIGRSILPVQTSVIRVQRFRGDVHLILDIDTERQVSRAAGNTNDTYTIPLKDAFGP